MKYKYFLASWICVLFFANSFAQSDTINLTIASADTVSKILPLKKDTAIAISKTYSSTTGKCYNGVASYYAQRFEGRKTATGETFRHVNYTAASNNFKLNTWVKVTNIKNGKFVIVRINDRMAPAMSAKGRIVDLTYTAAKELGIINSGTGKVKVEVLEKLAKN